MKSKLDIIEKKRLFTFYIVTFGISVLMGIIMVSFRYRKDNMIHFYIAQMFYPAIGVIISAFLTRREDNVPLLFFVGYLILSTIIILVTIMENVVPFISKSNSYTVIPIMGGLLLFLLLVIDKKETLKSHGLLWFSSKKSWFYILLFLVLFYGLYLGINGIILVGRFSALWSIWAQSILLPSLLRMPIDFMLSYIMFFGEEYGWRYFLQPLMQKQYGNRKGIILLGAIWGLWHLPLILPSYPLQSWHLAIINQLIVCISRSIFFGYAYIKTKNIWVPTILHFLNNNLSVMNVSMLDLTSRTIDMNEVFISAILNGLTFVPFIFTKAFKKTENPIASKLDG